MAIFGLIKDICLLPADVVLDVTGITPAGRILGQSSKDSPFGTIDRIVSIAKNIDETTDGGGYR